MENLKYLHLYSDKCWCESDTFKGTPNTIVLTDEQYKQLGETLKFENGNLAVITEEENNKQMTAPKAPKSTIE